MHEFTCRVYYEDTDLAGIVYHANYLKFIERARSENLRTIGISQSALREKGLVFSVVELTCHYLRPARYDDRLRVETRFVEMMRASLRLQQTIFRGESKLFSADVRLAVMTPEGRARRIPKEECARFNLLLEGVSS